MERMVTLIGYGEAGRTFARAGGWEQHARVFDIKVDKLQSRDAMLAAFEADGVSAATNLDDAVGGSDAILSLVTADQALASARNAAQHITPGALYFDMNSVAPDTKREAAKLMIGDARAANPEGEITLGADKGYDAAEFIKALQDMKVTPHVAQNKSNRKSAVPDEIASTEGYGISMQKRKLIEQGFGWAKFIGPIRQVMVRGIKKVDQVFMMAMAAYNLVRMRTLGQVRLQGAQ